MENPTKKCKQCQSDIPIKAKKCPQCHTDLRSWINRHPILSFFGLIILIFLFISSNSDSPTPEPAPVTSNLSMVFDVPSLVEKDLTELRATLGTPSWDKEPGETWIKFSEGERTWEKTWEKSGYNFTVSYNYDTKEITEFLLDGMFNTTADIIKVGNLSTQSDQYSVEFIKIKYPANTPGYNGATIRKK